jgi:CubicO group peptidase (beta-lactamase class C family)
MTVDTTFQVMSASKAVVAFAIALLEDRGLIDVEAPVAHVWPEFGARGKAEITVLDVLTHRSGLTLEDLVAAPARWRDWHALAGAISEAPLDYPRGTLAYEAYAFGWILGEIVRRITGHPIDDFVAEELGPDLDKLRFKGTAPRAVARNYWLGQPDFRLGRLDLAKDFETVNNGVACFEALVPGAGMLTDGVTLTAFYSMLLRGGLLPSGRRLIRSEVLERYIRRQGSGWDRITHSWVVFGRGLAMGWNWPHPYGWWGSSRCFGHAGGFSMLGMADPESDMSIAILTIANRSVGDLVRRFAPLTQMLRRAGRAAA